MKYTPGFTLLLLCALFNPTLAQTSHLDGETKLINPTGRTLLLERDDEDSWLTFHDPGNTWYSMGIDYSDFGKFKLNFGSILGENNHITLTSTGKLGIGTTDPKDVLHVNGDYTGKGHFMLYAYEGEGNSGSTYIQARDRSGTSSINMQFRTQNNGVAVEAMRIASNGNIGIGTNSPDAKLAVKGDIHAQEVKVDLNVPGPDYVFEEGYDLPTLKSTQSYIYENKHLPEVPSAHEMEKNGIDLGEMNMLLLKKVEELTLHLIEQNEVNQNQSERIKILESKLKEL
ncbi:hypothetical protein FNH22_24075 [Fulvivirga sp. M361]|uniref:tail fiber protein n=1 Tax=Fulvivirga sp. M361 TaxID=2594266 RepID=UPI00117A62E7|nr:tail fiber protein [Fulvivirga sp. M361]TRX51642.1 hypothetical protein FNH22_24075 [Fulvivirga sp. M361]